MGMGYSAVNGYLIKEESLRHFAGQAYDNLMGIIHSWDIDYSLVHRALEHDDQSYWDIALEDIIHEDVKPKVKEEIRSGYAYLQEAFELQTGLRIVVSHHDQEEEGSRYDEVSGLFFTVSRDQLYESRPTEAMKRLTQLGHAPELVSYVVFG